MIYCVAFILRCVLCMVYYAFVYYALGDVYDVLCILRCAISYCPV